MKIILPQIKDDRGILSIIDYDSIPFEIKRCFFIHNITKNRGSHAHYECLQAIMIIQGKCDIEIINKNGKVNYTPNLFEIKVIDKLNWVNLKNISNDCIIMVYASQKYNESDYIRDYNNFLRIIK